MHFKIRHQTCYRYSGPVQLGPHLLRFHPRDDGTQRLIDFNMHLTPAPIGRNDHLELEGNRVTQVWFEGKTDRLEVEVSMQVETLRTNPFDFILEREAMQLPIGHAPEEACARAYLERIEIDDSVTAYAAELSLSVERNTLEYLAHLSRQLFTDFSHEIRHTGAPQTPAQTLSSRCGACRDLSVLFVDCCRAEGIPARFVSGYQRGDLQWERRHLHAWPEVYLPGAGWRPFDPTHGEAVADTHVTIAAAAHPRDTLPITGSFIGKGVSSTLDFKLEIEVL